ncbi:MAG: hypothetical protein ACI9W4_001269 [Rhodothermales bacterium]|jgi:hypothetical protein
MRLSTVLSLLVVSLAIGACQSNTIDNSIIVDPGPVVSYASDVQPIFASGCGGFGCHVGEATNGVDLSTHSATVGSVGLQYGGPVIIAGNGSGSPLVDKVSASPREGSRMPLGQSALTASQVEIIKTWIDDGAENN